MKFAKEEAFTAAHGGRSHVADVLIVITDGEYYIPRLLVSRGELGTTSRGYKVTFAHNQTLEGLR